MTAIWLLAVLSFAVEGRRLRYRRLHRHQSLATARWRDFKSLLRRSPQPRAARHHRTGDQSHVGPASLVPARPPCAKPGSTVARLLRLERHAGEVHGRTDHFQGLRALELDLGSGGQGVLLAPLLLPSAGLEFRQSGRAARPMLKVLDFLAGDGRRRSAAGCGALSLRARRHQLREPAGDARLSARSCGRTSTNSITNRMLLAEANQWPEDAAAYFGNGDECHMAFHFPLMPRMFMAIQMEDRFPIIDILEQTPAIPDNCQWAMFLRNHDELTLEMVTDEERDYMYRVYAPGSAGAHQPRHSPPAGAAAGQRSREDRAAEQPAVLAARHPGPLLRRRDRHGGQYLSRRSQRRPHTDAMEPRPQCRLLAGPIRRNCICRSSSTPSTTTKRSMSRRPAAESRIRCSGG